MDSNMPPPLAVSHPSLRMIEAFAGVGVTSFDISFTDVNETPTGFRRSQSVSQVILSMRHFIARAALDRNVIIRPNLPKQRGALIQLDDIKDEAMQNRLAPFAFLTVETSPGNRQIWIAVADPQPDTRRRLKKGAAADRNASGAVRLAGTANRKIKYAPNFPIVRIASLQPGLTITHAQIEAAGLLPTMEHAPASSPKSRRRGQPRQWPSYAKVLEGAPRGEGRGEQRYSADFTFAMIAIDWGWSPGETAARLMQDSSKAQENGQDYADMTARNAAAAVERRAMQNRQRRASGPP